METWFADRPDVRDALAAIERVVGGEPAGSLETARLDFKEEAGRRGRDGSVLPQPGSLPETAAIAAEESCCLSNTEGGVIVVGVADGVAGAGALIGTHIDAEQLRERIWEQTTPRLSVDVHEYSGHGPRLLLVHVRRGYRLHHAKKKGYRQRVGAQCVEMTPEQQRAWEEARSGYDWSSEPSSVGLPDVIEGAVDQARSYLGPQQTLRALNLPVRPLPNFSAAWVCSTARGN